MGQPFLAKNCILRRRIDPSWDAKTANSPYINSTHLPVGCKDRELPDKQNRGRLTCPGIQSLVTLGLVIMSTDRALDWYQPTRRSCYSTDCIRHRASSVWLPDAP